MDYYSEMRIFAAVAEENSLASAARRLQLSAPTVTRAVAGLEQRLGVALLERSTRGVQLTAAGDRYFQDCLRILADIDDAEQSAAGSHTSAVGSLNLSAPIAFGEQRLMPIVLDFLDAHPGVTVSAQFMDRFPNLHEENIDVAILTGELPDSSLVAIPVGAIRRVVVAAPEYLARQGRPVHPGELAHHQLLVSMADTRAETWRFRDQDKPLNLPIAARWQTSTNASAISAALAGAGITRVMSYQVRDMLEEGRLQLVLEDFELPAIPVHVVYREGRRAAARVRGFVDYAVQALRASSL